MATSTFPGQAQSNQEHFLGSIFTIYAGGRDSAPLTGGWAGGRTLISKNRKPRQRQRLSTPTLFCCCNDAQCDTEVTMLIQTFLNWYLLVGGFEIYDQGKRRSISTTLLPAPRGLVVFKPIRFQHNSKGPVRADSQPQRRPGGARKGKFKQRPAALCRLRIPRVKRRIAAEGLNQLPTPPPQAAQSATISKEAFVSWAISSCPRIGRGAKHFLRKVVGRLIYICCVSFWHQGTHASAN
jgi:hypothetical protein